MTPVDTQQLPARNRLLTLAAASGHVFRLQLSVGRDAGGLPVCHYRLNQFDTPTSLVVGIESGLVLEATGQSLPALRAQLGLTPRTGFLVCLTTAQLLELLVAGRELLHPFQLLRGH